MIDSGDATGGVGPSVLLEADLGRLARARIEEAHWVKVFVNVSLQIVSGARCSSEATPEVAKTHDTCAASRLTAGPSKQTCTNTTCIWDRSHTYWLGDSSCLCYEI